MIRLDYTEDPQRRPVPSDQVGDRIGHEMAQSMIDWGAKQVKWRPGRQDVFPYIPTAHPGAPNNEGVVKFYTPDTDSPAYTSAPISLTFLHNTRSAPSYWEKAIY